MDPRRRNVRLGLLLVLAALGAAGTVAWAIWNKLRDPKEHYFVLYRESVSGLEIGTTVRMKGVNVGQVRRIAVTGKAEAVGVTLALTPGTPITVDTRAVLTPLGITGLKFIELTGGTARSRRIPPDTPRSVIPAGASVLRTLMKRGGRIVAKADLLRQNLGRLARRLKASRMHKLEHDSRRLFATMERIGEGNSQRMSRISHNIDRVTRAMEQATRALSRLRNDVGQQLPEARSAAIAAVRDLERAVSGLQLEPLEQELERAVSAARRRGETLNLESTAATFSAASARLERVGERLGSSITRTDEQWTEVKKNLRKAGRFIQQLKDRYVK